MTSLGLKLAIALHVFVKHERSVSFSSLSKDIARRQIRKSDAALVRKLKSFFGLDARPTSAPDLGLRYLRRST